jgi:hypothetical protein
MRLPAVLTFTFIFGIVVFLLSLIALKHHNENEEALSGDGGDRLSQLKRSFKLNINVSDYLHALDPIFHPARYGPQSVIELPGIMGPQSGVNTSISPGISSETPPFPCTESFPTKCEMYPYVKFWNKKFSSEDCYRSPLRHPLGDKAPAAEQKYVIFQPDGGGWNNIRMAAEVVMIFAHATGR